MYGLAAATSGRIGALGSLLDDPALQQGFEQEAKALRQVVECQVALYVVDARDRVLGRHRDELKDAQRDTKRQLLEAAKQHRAELESQASRHRGSDPGARNSRRGSSRRSERRQRNQRGPSRGRARPFL